MSDQFLSTAYDEILPNPYDVPLERLDLSDPRLPGSGMQLDYYKRIREEDPLHYLKDSKFGPFWSITTYADMHEVELNPEIFSSDWRNGGVLILDDMNLGFMSLDDPVHADQRRSIMPLMTPSNLASLSESIKQRTHDLLDNLPVGESFDWVDTVSVELTVRMLAILLDFPFEERHLLPYWTEWATNVDAGADPELSAKREEILFDMATRLKGLYEERKKQPVKGDLISILAHSEEMGDMNDEDFMGMMVLLIVGGNDTTRNSMTAMIRLMCQYPEEWAKVKKDRSLGAAAAQETFRWQSPVGHQRRTVLKDTVLNGKQLSKGDKVILWFRAANHDEKAFPQANIFNFERENVRRHVCFGHGVHRCFGARLGELQLRILMDALFDKGITIHLEEEAEWSPTCMMNGYEHQMVSITRESA